MITVPSSPVAALGKAVAKVGYLYMTLKMIGKMITGEASLKNVTGPITIADYAGADRATWAR
jgi:regulator of sigma E protease